MNKGNVDPEYLATLKTCSRNDETVDDGHPEVGCFVAIEMSDKYLKEMVCDWRGAGKAQGTPDTQKWYGKNKHRMILHVETRRKVEELLGYEG